MGAAMSATINTISQEAYGALEVYRNWSCSWISRQDSVRELTRENDQEKWKAELLIWASEPLCAS